MKPFAIYSGQQTVGSWGWRHALSWQQLSALWGLQVQRYFSEFLPELPVPACAYAVAIAPGEFVNLISLDNYFTAAPVVLFFNCVSLQLQEHIDVEEKDDQTPRGSFQHVFKINTKSHLTTGLPGQVVTYGPLSDITPLPAETDLQVLVWLDGMPIIGYRAPHLLMGVDAWQLGNPSVPMVYAILMNWLRTVVGIELQIAVPLAAIRLDDLPVTAYELLHRSLTPVLDRQRAKTLRRLRQYAFRSHIRLSLMYTSHYFSSEGSLHPIANVMPGSIREMQIGVKQKVFEIGAHGMVHLRYTYREAVSDGASEEFQDLDEGATSAHLDACESEITRLFGTQPTSFVAPAWGYRPGLTKKIAGQRFLAVIDSSQHMEDGSGTVFSLPGEELPAFNCMETFRPGSRMLSFTSPDFWKCYALGGIPVHYMQHTDTNWHLLQSFLSDKPSSAVFLSSNRNDKLVEYMQAAGKPRFLRLMAAAWLLIDRILRKPSSFKYLLKLLSESSLYMIIKALQTAGYQCIGITELVEIMPEFHGK